MQELVIKELTHIGHYPDNSYINFRRAAARFVGVDMENIVPGNGSSELIRLFAEATLEEGDLALIPFPTFGEYENQARLAGATIRRVEIGQDDLPILSDTDLEEAKALFICNPNNPTGKLLTKEQISELVGELREDRDFSAGG